MSNTSLWDMSTTPASNTSIQGNSVAENCAPSGINDAIRALAAMGKGALIAVSSAGTDTYTATLAPIPDALVTGMGVYIKFGNANLLSSSTLSVNGLTQKTIKKNGATAILPGDIPAGHMGALYYDGTSWILQNPAMTKQPTRSVLTTGTGATYTTKDGCTRINIRMVGGGGGGAGSGTSPSASGNGTASTWSGGSLSAGGGTGASAANGGGGGSAANGDVNIPGGVGAQCGAIATSAGGMGGASVFGGAGTCGASSSGGAAQTNSGSGGGGGASAGTVNPGGGGGAGAYVEKLITAPSATYTYTVGALGGNGGGGTGGAPGGSGAAGIIIVDEYYN